MRKLLKTLIASLSVLLLSACSLFDNAPKDWTKGYLDESTAPQVYTSEVSPLLKMENNSSNPNFAYVTFQGKCEMLAGGGPNIMKKFETMWQTEVKDAISDILVNRWKEEMFSMEENHYIRGEYELDLRLNGLFYSIFLYNEKGEAQYFTKFIATRNNKSKCLNLCEYTVEYYNKNDESIFHFEFEHYYLANALQ